MSTRFFLTHSWKDIDFARRLRKDLAASGLDGFFDALSIQPGDLVSLEINRGLEACDIYVPILSHAALQSPWCEEEIHAAITLGKLPGRNGRPRIVPVLVEDCADEMPILLRARLYIVFANRYDEALEELLTKAFGVPGREARGKAEQERVAKEKAEAERLAPEKAEQERLAREKGEQQRLPRKRKALPAATGGPELKSARAYYNRAVRHHEDGDLTRALADYNQALSLNPKYGDAYNNRGSIYKDKGDLDRALADFNQALNLNPKDAIPYCNRGNVYIDKGDLDRALADINQALSLNPKYANAYNLRGNVYKDKGDLDRALADINQALSLNPRSGHAYDSRGSVYYDKGDLDRALADFNQALSLDSKIAIAYKNRGNLYRNKGSKAQAIADYEAYVRLSPDASDRAKVEQWIRELKG